MSVVIVHTVAFVHTEKSKAMFAFMKVAIIEHSVRERGGKCIVFLGSASGWWIKKKC
jgi:hypothetical protein